MTSFGATKIIHNEDDRNCEYTFKIQGQVYHRIGSLLPMPDADPKSYTLRIQPYRTDRGTRNCGHFGNVFAKP